MEKHLDKFIKDKLSNQRFPLDDEAWEGMETILDSEQVPSLRNNKKPFKLYKIAGLMCLLVLCYTIFMFSMKKRKQKHVHHVEVIAESTPQAEIDSEIKQTDGLTATDAYDTAQLSSQTNQTSSTESPEIQNAITKEEASFTQTQITKIAAKTVQETSIAEILEQSTNMQSESKTKSEVTDIETNRLHTGSTISKQTKSQFNKTKQPARNTTFLPPLSNLVKLDIQQLVFAQELLEGPDPSSKVQILTEKRRPAFGIYFASQNYDTDRSYSAGMHGQYFLGDRWSISVEPGYSYRALAATSVAKDSSEFVSFGANKYQQEIKGESVHAIHVPMFLNYNVSNSVKFGAGLSYNRVMALGAMKETKIDDVVTEEKSIWLDKEFYTNNYYRTQFYAAYNLHRNVSLDVQYELPLKKTQLFNQESSIGLRLKIYL